MEQASWWSDRTHRVVVAVVAAVVVIVAIVLWLVLRGGSDDNGSATPSGSGSPTAGASVQGRSPAPTGNPTATPPPAPKPVKHPPKPVHAAFGTKAQSGAVTASISKVESVKGQARGIGEIAGPAVRFTVKLTNTGSKPVDLNLALVNVYYGPQKTPASQLSGPGSVPLPQTLKSGVATGRYVFGIPRDHRGKIRVEFSYDARQPTVIFRGSA